MSSTPESWKEKHTVTWEEYFDTRFIEAMKLSKILRQELGEERAFELISKKAYEAETEFGKEIKGDKPITTKEDLSNIFRKLLDTPYFKRSNKVEIHDNSDEGFNYTVHNCIWAHTFRKHDESELGYHMICHGDYGIANGLGKNVELRRNMTLMQGDPCCDFMWLWRGE